MWKKVIRTFLTTLILCSICVSLYLFMDFRAPADIYSFSAGDIFLDIPRNSNRDQVADILIASGLIKSRFSYYFYRKFIDSRPVQSGYYRLSTGKILQDNLSKVHTGDVEPRFYYFNLTFPEGYSIYQISEKLEQYHVCDARQFRTRLKEHVKDDEFKDKYNIPVHVDYMEGFLFPDTYRVRIGLHPDLIISMMLHRFNQIFNSELRGEVKKKKKDFYKTLIIASLIEKEAGRNDHDLISSVIHNRLRLWYMLQIDATILYALGPDANNITLKNKYIDSPYNTYKRYGLPPTPICNPGKKSILAAINPPETEYLYYVSRNDGTHIFAKSYKEHRKNVIKFQKRR